MREFRTDDDWAVAELVALIVLAICLLLMH
jgi:hypothetical protein